MSSTDGAQQRFSPATESPREPVEAHFQYAEPVRGRIEERLRSQQYFCSHLAFWSLLAVCGYLAVLLSLWLQDRFPEFGLDWTSFIPPAILCVVPIVGWSIVIRSKRLIRGVCDDPGRALANVCPSCGGDPFVGDRCCVSFVPSWSSQDLDRYWSDYAWDGLLASSVCRGGMDAGSRLNLIQQLGQRLFGVSPGNQLILIGTCIVLLFAVLALVLLTPYGTTSLFLLPGGLVMWIIVKKGGDVTHPLCRECDHPTPPGASFVSGQLCPECGKNLFTVGVHFGSGSVEKSRRRLVPWIVGISCIFMLAQPLLLLNGVGLANLTFSILPTSVLIDRIPTDAGSDHVWNELLSRECSAEESTLLFEQLQQFIADSGSEWLSTYYVENHPAFKAFAAGTWPGPLNPDQIGEVKGMLEYSLNVQRPVMTGDQVTLMVRFRDRSDSDLPWYHSTSILFDGVAIDDGPYTDQHDQAILVEEWNGLDDSRTYRDADSERIPRTRIRIDEPGVHRVRAAFWLFDQPAASAGFSRDESGEVQFSPETRWFKRVVLEDEFEVYESPDYETVKNELGP